MIPSSLTAARGFVLRKIRGRYDACRALTTSTGHRLHFASPMQTVGVFMSIVLPLLLLIALVGALLTGHASSAIAMPLPFAIGSTTGTQTSGFTGLNDMLKQVYTKAFENNVEKESELADVLQKAEGFDVVEGPDGKGVNMGHIFSSGGGVGSMNEDDYLYTPTNPTAKTSSITIKQHVAVVELSGRTLRRVKKGPAAFVTWADEALPRKAARLAFHKDRQYLGTGTGIICRVNQGSPSGTADGIDNMFGISGLDDGAANLMLRDDPIRWGPNANGTALRTGNVTVTSLNFPNKTLTCSALPTSGADNDYIFLGDGNVQGIGTREMMGLEGIIDDSTNVATFQGLARSTYPELNAQVIDSTGSGFDGTVSEEILDYAYQLAFERGAMGKPSLVVLNRSGARSFWKNLKNDRVINDPRGTYEGGKATLKMILGDGIATVRACRKVPLSRCYGIDPATIQRYRIGEGRWDDTDGSIWNRVVDSTGRKDAFFAVYVEEEEIGSGNPGGNFKLTTLSAA